MVLTFATLLYMLKLFGILFWSEIDLFGQWTLYGQKSINWKFFWCFSQPFYHLILRSVIALHRFGMQTCFKVGCTRIASFLSERETTRSQCPIWASQVPNHIENDFYIFTHLRFLIFSYWVKTKSFYSYLQIKVPVSVPGLE